MHHRCPAIVDVEPAEHARDRDRLRRVGDRQGTRWYALLDALVRSALVEVALVLAQKVGKMLVVDEQHVVEQFAGRTRSCGASAPSELAGRSPRRGHSGGIAARGFGRPFRRRAPYNRHHWRDGDPPSSATPNTAVPSGSRLYARAAGDTIGYFVANRPLALEGFDHDPRPRATQYRAGPERYHGSMAKARRRVRWIVAGAVALAALVLNPMFGVFSGPRFGAAALRAAVEGTWRLTVDDAGATRTVTFRIAQGTEADAAEVERAEHVGLVRPAGACGHRSLVRSAGACRDWTSMPLEVTLIADGEARRVAPGTFSVVGSEFQVGELTVTVADVELSAQVTPAGDVREVWIPHSPGQMLRSTLARIAR
jgi:hypothetical protein